MNMQNHLRRAVLGTLIAASLQAVPALGADKVATFSYPINPSYTYNGRCPGGFAPIDFHMYYDPSSALKGWHMGEDWNGYLANGDACGNNDEGADVRSIGDGTIVSATDQGTGRGNVLITRHTLPDDRQTQVDLACYHLQRFERTSGTVYAGTLVAKLGRTGGVPAHLHCEATLVSATGTKVNPWHDVCTNAGTNQSTPGHCTDNPNAVKRPFMTAANAARYISPSLLLESRMNGVAYSIPATDGIVKVTVGKRAPGGFAYVSKGSDRRSIKRAVEAGWIKYGLLRQESSGWVYLTDSNRLVMHPNVQYGVLPLVSGLGLAIAYPNDTQRSMEELARFDLVQEANDAGLKYIDPDAMVRNPPYASGSDYDFYAMPATKTTNATKGDANFKHTVLVAIHRTEPWTRRQSAVWDADQRAWSAWKSRGYTIP